MFKGKKRAGMLTLSPVCGVLLGAMLTAGIGMLMMRRRCSLLKMTEDIRGTVMGRKGENDCPACEGA